MDSQKVTETRVASFRRKPESRKMELVPGFRRDDAWTPVFTGVTTFYEVVIFYLRRDT